MNIHWEGKLQDLARLYAEIDTDACYDMIHKYTRDAQGEHLQDYGERGVSCGAMYSGLRTGAYAQRNGCDIQVVAIVDEDDEAFYIPIKPGDKKLEAQLRSALKEERLRILIETGEVVEDEEAS